MPCSRKNGFMDKVGMKMTWTTCSREDFEFFHYTISKERPFCLDVMPECRYNTFHRTNTIHWWMILFKNFIFREGYCTDIRNGCVKKSSPFLILFLSFTFCSYILKNTYQNWWIPESCIFLKEEHLSNAAIELKSTTFWE